MSKIVDYFLLRGSLNRKYFVLLCLGVVLASIAAMLTYIGSLTPAEYEALKEWQQANKTGSLPDGYGWVEPLRLVLLWGLIPAFVLRLRNIGWWPWLALLVVPSLMVDSLAYINIFETAMDLQFLFDCIAALLMLTLFFKKPAK